MFWIGIIIGIVVGAIAVCTIFPMLAAKLSNMSLEEFTDCIKLISVAGENREAIMSVRHDGMLLKSVILEEK